MKIIEDGELRGRAYKLGRGEYQMILTQSDGEVYECKFLNCEAFLLYLDEHELEVSMSDDEFESFESLKKVRDDIEKMTPEMSDLFEDLNESLNNLQDAVSDVEDRMNDCREHFRKYADVVHGFLYPANNKPDYEERA